jgi:hypothetical protein
MKKNDQRWSMLSQDQDTALTQPNEDYCTSHTDDLIRPCTWSTSPVSFAKKKKKFNSNEDYSAEIPMSWWQPDTFDG